MELDQERLAEMKRAEIRQDGLVGLWALFKNPFPCDDVMGKGRIIGREGDYLIVQRFCITTGEHDAGITLRLPSSLTLAEGVVFYPTAELMEQAWEDAARIAARRRAEELRADPVYQEHLRELARKHNAAAGI